MFRAYLFLVSSFRSIYIYGLSSYRNFAKDQLFDDILDKGSQ